MESRLANSRVDSRFESSQWETALLCNDVSNWLGASLDSALQKYLYQGCFVSANIENTLISITLGTSDDLGSECPETTARFLVVVCLLVYWHPFTLLTCFNFNPSMDKWLHLLKSVGWTYLSIPNFIGVTIEAWEWLKKFHPTLYWECDY